MRVSSPAPKVIQQLLTSSSSSSCHFYLPLYLSLNEVEYDRGKYTDPYVNSLCVSILHFASELVKIEMTWSIRRGNLHVTGAGCNARLNMKLRFLDSLGNFNPTAQSSNNESVETSMLLCIEISYTDLQILLNFGTRYRCLEI